MNRFAFAVDHLRQALNEDHYLKAGRPAGNVRSAGLEDGGSDTDWASSRGRAPL